MLVYIICVTLSLLQGSPYSIYSYDAAYLYFKLLKEIILENGNPRDGKLMYAKAQNYMFEGMNFVYVHI